MTCVRVDGLGSLPRAKVRAVLFVYFDWREKRLAQMLLAEPMVLSHSS